MTIKRAQVAADAFEKEVNTPKSETVYSKPLIVSTGSTLLDCAILGTKVRGGGVPGGIAIEIYSLHGLGKTAIASEIAGNAQASGGDVQFRDPEGRLDKEYAELYGMHLPEGNYKKTHYVPEIFKDFMAWNPPTDKVSVWVTDSLAALTTKLEMEKGDKMGMRRAKELNEGYRKASVVLSESNRLFVCTNHLKEGDSGKFTPGGSAPKYWSSVRIELKMISQYTKGQVNKNGTITETIKVGDKKREVEQQIGIRVLATVTKNSRDVSWRTAPVAIVHNYGVDDIRENLQYVKDIMGYNTFETPDGQSFLALKDAIAHIEAEGLEQDLKELVIDIWEEVQEAIQDASRRKKKER